MDFINAWNTFAWVAANLLVGYIAIAVILFVIGYWILFDPRATTAGRNIFRFFVSLLLIIGLVFVGLFIDPHVDRPWFTYPGDVNPWRPTLRLLGYGYVAYTITSLAVLLVIRKWWPQKLRTALDKEIVKTRHEVDTETK